MKSTITLVLILSSLNFISYSQPYFQKITSGEIVSSVTSSNRCAWGDYDNDGYQDLIVSGWSDICWNCPYPVLLYHNNGNGTFTRITTGPITEFNGRAFGTAWGDYDNDGKLDLFICLGFNENNLLFHNEGNANFTRVMTGVIVNDGGWSETCAWSDYDRDGWIDLFVGNQSFQNNFLYHNNGNGTFTKITSGSIVNNASWSRGCAWGDYDNDGWPDLFVVNYQSGANDFLYHNNGNGTFTRIFSGPHVNDNDWGSGCAWGDYDNDGNLDLYVTNNNSFNRLYYNNGGGNFTVSSIAPSYENGFSFGAGWADYNNDGLLDLFVAKQQTSNALFRNDGGTFTRVTNEIPGTEGYNSGLSVWGDYDNNGKMDLFVTTTGSPTNNRLYKNIGNTGNYIVCKLKGGCLSNKAAIGARIKIYSGNYFAMREISGGSNMGTQDMLWQHFGLGNRTMIDSIIVSWPHGPTPKIQKLSNIGANQFITIDECTIGIISNEIPVKYELRQNYPNPFNPVTQIEYSLQQSSIVKIIVYDVTGRVIKTLVNEYQNYGTFRIDFDGSNLPSGVYIYRITANDFTDTKKMILIK